MKLSYTIFFLQDQPVRQQPRAPNVPVNASHVNEEDDLGIAQLPMDDMAMNVHMDFPMDIPPEKTVLETEELRQNSAQSRDPSFAASLLGASR